MRRRPRPRRADDLHLRPVLIRLLTDLRSLAHSHRLARPRSRARAAVARARRHVHRPVRRRHAHDRRGLGRERPGAGAICGFEGVGTLWLNAGTLPAHSGCFYLFNAPAARADRRRQRRARLGQGERRDRALLVLVRGRRRRHDPPLQRRLVHRRDRHERRQLGRARDLQRGRRRHRDRHAARQQHRVRRRLGHDLRPDEARIVGERPDRRPVRRRGAAAVVGQRQRERIAGGRLRDRRRRARGHPRPGLLVDLQHARQRERPARPVRPPRRATRGDGIREVVCRRGAGYGPFAFRVDRTAPAQPLVRVVPDAAAAAAGWWGHAPVALSVSTATAPDVDGSTPPRLRPLGRARAPGGLRRRRHVGGDPGIRAH